MEGTGNLFIVQNVHKLSGKKWPPAVPKNDKPSWPLKKSEIGNYTCIFVRLLEDCKMCPEETELPQEISLSSYGRINHDVSIHDMYQVVSIAEITALHGTVKGGVTVK